MNPLTLHTDTRDAVIAIVDDDDQIAGALGMWFNLCGRPTRVHTSAESLLRALRAKDDALLHELGQAATPDALPLAGAVLDLNLGGMNGVALARELRELNPTLPIVIISALPKEELAPYGGLPKGVSFLRKPFDLDLLEEALSPTLTRID